jgi:hypothetical protein
MDKSRITKIVSEQVYAKFPEFNGLKPTVKWNFENQANHEACTLVFQTHVQTVTGKKMQRRVKVIADSMGKILKIINSK